MALNLTDVDDDELRARITVFGVGGAGGNAINNMIEKELAGVEFVAANTDAQALGNSKATRRIQLGQGVTRGLGAGSKPDVGMSAAEESTDEIATHLEGCHMCFITGGMGGGTGTGAAPVVARIAREMGILTVGVVTKPFQFEGARRMKLAEAGVAEMQNWVDTLIVIPNQNLFQVASEHTTFVQAFQLADDVLYQGVQGVTDLMVRPGMINLDFADVRSVMEEMGKAMMGTGEAEGQTRAIDAAEKAIANPLLDEVSLKGAKGVLINITGGYDLTLFEMDEAANRIKDEVDANALIKFGSAIDPDMDGKMRVSVVATGIDAEQVSRPVEDTGAPSRRRPAMTDSAGIDALRGGQARTAGQPPAPAPQFETEFEPRETAEPVAAEPPAEAPTEADERPTPASVVASARATLAAAFRGEPAEAAPASYAAPPREQRPAANPTARLQPAREAVAAPSAESRIATAPSPDEIRARAERVREQARVAREQTPRAAPSFDDDTAPGLFDLDDVSIDRGSAATGVESAAPMPDRGAAAAPASQPAAQGGAQAAGRAGLFTINRLINRVAGHQEPGVQRRIEPQTGARSDAGEDEDGDIPAFLRRQAN
ncbi:MAG: cell division protein FtsZ [Pseudomonadota bacterium]